MPRQNTHYCNRHRVASLLFFACALIRLGITIQNIKFETQDIKLLNRVLDNVPDLESIEDAAQKEMVYSNLESIMQNYNPINSLYLVLMIITSLFLSLSACLSYDSLEKEREDMITTTNENKISETEVNSNETEHKPGSHFNIK